MSAVPVLTFEMLDTMSKSEVKAVQAVPQYKTVVLKWREAEAERMERKADQVKDGKTTLNITLEDLTYEDLLHLAAGVTNKKWYEMPEGNIVSRIAEEVSRALEGVQSREANALKAEIAAVAEAK